MKARLSQVIQSRLAGTFVCVTAVRPLASFNQACLCSTSRWMTEHMRISLDFGVQEEGSCRGERPLRLLERSVFSDRMVFVRAVHEARWMDDMELAVYDSWCAPVPHTQQGSARDWIFSRWRPEQA